MHLDGYCNIDPALPRVDFISRMTRQLVEAFQDDVVEAVLVPAIGAIPMAQWAPYWYRELTGREIPGVWADKVKPRGFVIERNGFAAGIAGKRVLILEDMINQMYSVKELDKIVRQLGGKTVGVGALIANRGVTAAKIGVPKFVGLCEFAYEAWDETNCELCKSKVPIVVDPALGHGEEFRQAHPNYAGGFVTIG